MEDLDRFQKAKEPQGEIDFRIKSFTTKNRDGKPLTSKFSEAPQIMFILDHDGFEFSEFCDLPEEGDVISLRSKLAILMEYCNASKISEMKNCWVSCRKVFIKKSGKEKWSIVGSPKHLHAKPVEERPNPETKPAGKSPFQKFK